MKIRYFVVPDGFDNWDEGTIGFILRSDEVVRIKGPTYNLSHNYKENSKEYILLEFEKGHLKEITVEEFVLL